MKLTPIDIEQQKFKVAFRGYEPREVQHFLEMVSAQTAELNREITELRHDLRRGHRELEDLRGREENLKEAMLTAQRAIDELRETAHKEAQLVLGEAEMRAEKILHNAHRKATQIHEEINELRRQRIRFVEELRGVVNTHARLLDVHAEDVRDTQPEASVTVLERLRAPAPPSLQTSGAEDAFGGHR